MIEELKRKEEGSSADVIEMHVKSHADTLITVSELAKLTALSLEEVEQDVKELEGQGSVYVFPIGKIPMYGTAIRQEGRTHFAESSDRIRREVSIPLRNQESTGTDDVF